MAYSMAPRVDLLGQSVQQSTPPPFFSSSSGGHRHSIQDATSSTPSVLIRWMLTVLQVSAECSGNSSQGFDNDPFAAWGRGHPPEGGNVEDWFLHDMFAEAAVIGIPQRMQCLQLHACKVHLLL